MYVRYVEIYIGVIVIIQFKFSLLHIIFIVIKSKRYCCIPFILMLKRKGM